MWSFRSNPPPDAGCLYLTLPLAAPTHGTQDRERSHANDGHQAGGRLRDRDSEYLVRTLNQYTGAEDIAETLIFFLLGAGSRLITGETLIVDSGIHLGKLPPYAGGTE